MITAMTFFVILSVAVVLVIAATVRNVFHDAPAARPRSHRVDPDFVSPGSRVPYDRAA
ncbi:MAG: hypothetical protein JWN84_4397 [Nocardioides sp.]|nr:hypothetical protein [Nocardioides sp.]